MEFYFFVDYAFEKHEKFRMRKLKYHEKKLLKKVDFFNWEIDNNLHELKIMRKYRILKRENYTMYNKLSRYIIL